MKSCNYLLSLSAVYFTFTEIHIIKIYNCLGRFVHASNPSMVKQLQIYCCEFENTLF